MRTLPSISACLRALGLASFLTLLLAASASAATSTEIVSDVNAQRAANGIPAGITERPDWSQACAEHDGYMDQNQALGHGEDAALPGYTKDGAWAGQNSILSYLREWTVAQNPFASAPMHLAQLLAPDLAEMGADDNTSTGYSCATTWPGYTRPSPAAVTGYSYPGSGTTGVAASEVAAEEPFTPGEYAGFPEGTETGPYLMAFLDGPAKIDSATISGATLTGPDGPVAVEAVGSDDPDIGAYIPTPMAFLIPRCATGQRHLPGIGQLLLRANDDAGRVFVHRRRSAGRRPRRRRRCRPGRRPDREAEALCAPEEAQQRPQPQLRLHAGRCQRL